ncbi:glycosyltransferase [Thermosipho atlanticus]|uniref:Glycosyltransferase involved in cell wall bisynthesis n=1 Tax=Thermosipho atlanticus DSM 15807 TaxID=1123380 RepID=A0A1M5RKC9_9BACT|nr:glycosyltransferase [Thermosipho atlanticus]SHH26822.1 Glycosyltransferase involved in cell wall bisynthesis [Thermosipho atlanticus DSM 15807]
MKKKVLIFSTRLPYPPTAGFRKRILKFSEFLSNMGLQVDLSFIHSDSLDNQLIKKVKKLYDNIFPFYLTNFQKISGMSKAVFKNEPLQSHLYYSGRIAQKLSEIISKNHYNLILWNHIRAHEYRKHIFNDFSVHLIDYHDSLAYHYLIGNNKIGNFLWKSIYKMEGKRLLEYEKNILNDYKMAFITSVIDKYFIEPDDNKIKIIPMGVSRALLGMENDESDENIITFIGKMDYLPNVDAVVYFTKEILPEIDYDVKLYIIGTNPNKAVLNLQKKYSNVFVTGYIENPYKLMARSKIVIAPIRIGAGIQNKILEGMALGKPVVTFKERIKAFENIKNFQDVFAVNSSEEFVEAINSLLKNKTLRLEIGKNARNYIKENYTWKKIENKFRNYIYEVIE